MKRIALATAALAALTLTASAASEAQTAIGRQNNSTIKAVTCDDFIHRLKQAESALGIPMPQPDHDFADMGENIMGDMTSSAAYVIPALKDDDQMAILTCEKDGSKLFDEFDLNVPPIYNNKLLLKLNSVRTTNLIAAALYAYTGWPSKKIFATQRKLVDDLVQKQRLNLIRGEATDDVELTLPGNGVVRLSVGEDSGLHFVVTRDTDQEKND
jgi:hypothetical protein